MLSAAAAKALGALFKIPLTNLLGGVGMSYFSCAYSIFLPVYSLTVTGISAAVARMVAQSAALGLSGNIARIRHTALLLFTLVGTVGSAATLFLAKPFCTLLTGCPEAFPAVAMIAPAVLFGCVTAVGRGYYEGLSNMLPTALSQVAEGIVKVAAGLWLCSFVMRHSERFLAMFPQVSDVRALAAAAGILGVTLSSAGGMLFFGVLAIFRGKLPRGENALMPRRRIVRELCATALPVGASAVVTNLSSLIDMWTVIGCISRYPGSVHAPAGVAADEIPNFIYGSFAGIALTVFNLVPSVTNMLGKGVLPVMTAAWESHDREALRRGTMQALMTVSVIAVPAAIGLGVLSEEVLTVLFPRQSDEVAVCVNALRLLMPALVCLCVSFPLFSMLQAVGRAGAPLKIMLAGTVVKLVGNLLLIPLLGADGAAVSTSVCYAVILAAALRIYVRHTGINPGFAPFAGVLYAGAACGAAAYLTKSLLLRNGAGCLTVTAASAAVGAVVYGAAMWAVFSARSARKRTVRSC
ncbi:MAG: polysaccharide biosynthesis C-terminal domain-containing protein [Ruminococcus sp.]|nr:polysaccharide biosynthesis C-terminal domain-containing protein [Ruminococcus sp.]